MLDISLGAITDVTLCDPQNSIKRSNYHPHFAEQRSKVQSTSDLTFHCKTGRARSQTLG